MGDLGLRRPGHVLLEERSLLLGKGLQCSEGDGALRQAIVHEGDVVLQDGAIVVPPFRLHRRRIQAVQGGLHPAAIGQHRAAPGLVGGIVQIGPDHLGQRHRAVTDRLQQLIDDRHRRRLERRLAGPIEDEPPAGAGEQAQDDRVLGQNVLLEDLGSVAIELEHAGVERQHILVRGFAGGRGREADNRLHVGRQALGSRGSGPSSERYERRRRTRTAFQGRVASHGVPPRASAHQLPQSRVARMGRRTRPARRRWLPVDLRG